MISRLGWLHRKLIKINTSGFYVVIGAMSLDTGSNTATGHSSSRFLVITVTEINTRFTTPHKLFVVQRVREFPTSYVSVQRAHKYHSQRGT